MTSPIAPTINILPSPEVADSRILTQRARGCFGDRIIHYLTLSKGSKIEVRYPRASEGFKEGIGISLTPYQQLFWFALKIPVLRTDGSLSCIWILVNKKSLNTVCRSLTKMQIQLVLHSYKDLSVEDIETRITKALRCFKLPPDHPSKIAMRKLFEYQLDHRLFGYEQTRDGVTLKVLPATAASSPQTFKANYNGITFDLDKGAPQLKPSWHCNGAEFKQIVLYIQKHYGDLLDEYDERRGKPFKISSEAIFRSLIFCSPSKICVYRNKKSDGVIDYGGFKIVKLAQDLITGQDMAVGTLSTMTRTVPGSTQVVKGVSVEDMKKEILIRPHLKGIQGVIQDEALFGYVSNKKTDTGEKVYKLIYVEKKYNYSLAAALASQERPEAIRPISLDFTDKVRIAKSLLETLRACHLKGIVHRDIKPANILLTHKDDRIIPVLADFGASLLEGNIEAKKHLAGTIDYFSPEYRKLWDLKLSKATFEGCTKEQANEILERIRAETVRLTTPALDLWAMGRTLALMFKEEVDLPIALTQLIRALRNPDFEKRTWEVILPLYMAAFEETDVG